MNTHLCVSISFLCSITTGQLAMNKSKMQWETKKQQNRLEKKTKKEKKKTKKNVTRYTRIQMVDAHFYGQNALVLCIQSNEYFPSICLVFFVPFAALVVACRLAIRFTYYDCMCIPLFLWIRACLYVYVPVFVLFGRMWMRECDTEIVGKRSASGYMQQLNSPPHMSIQRALQCW